MAAKKTYDTEYKVQAVKLGRRNKLQFAYINTQG